MHNKLLTPDELDHRLGYRRGRSARLASRGLIPHLVLPDGEIRFDEATIEAWLWKNCASVAPSKDERQ
jgi:hypothetical protein